MSKPHPFNRERDAGDTPHSIQVGCKFMVVLYE